MRRALSVAALVSSIVLRPSLASPPESQLDMNALKHSVIHWMVPSFKAFQPSPKAPSQLASPIEAGSPFTTPQGLSPNGQALMAWLQRAPLHGVHLTVSPTLEGWQRHPNPQSRPSIEAELQSLALELATQLKPRPRKEAVLRDDRGRYLGPEVLMQTPPEALDAQARTTFMQDVARQGLNLTLEAYLPTHPQYQALVKAAERYQTLCQAGGFSALSLPKKGLKDEVFAQALRHRLAQEGFHGESDLNGLKVALVEYRQARQLSAKPEVDKALLNALNTPCEQRLESLVRNIKRWRHTAWQGESYRVEVNLAGQTFRLYRNHALLRQERTVVGSDKHFTSKRTNRDIYPNASPILTDQIETVVVNPEWNVPKRIARDEIEVKAAQDPTYLERNNFQIIEVGNARYYRQGSGAGNALGRIKILFPNPESVYLHDTPNRRAFNQPVRALSHGCVRLQNAVDVGTDLIAYDREHSGQDFNRERVPWLIKNSGKQTAFTIEHPVPIFLEYYTASVDEAGVVYFHPDIYGYDTPFVASVASED